jgi:nucleotide-binding universal stress UspA family protein
VKASTIVVGNRGMRGGRRVLGSVPDDVSHKADWNVLIVETDS